MTCQMCKNRIKSEADSYRFLDGDTFECDDNGYIPICENCAKRVLLNHRGIPVVLTLNALTEVV